MTEKELRALKRVTPNIAAEFLQGEYTGQWLRTLAQHGRCSFIEATRRSSRFSYHVSVGQLIKCRNGEQNVILSVKDAKPILDCLPPRSDSGRVR